MGSAPMEVFATGMHSAFWVSIVLVLIAAGILVRERKEDRKAMAEDGGNQIRKKDLAK